MQGNLNIITNICFTFILHFSNKGVYMDKGISNREMTTQMIKVLLYVAGNPAKTQKEICEATGINKGTISRVVLGVSSGNSKKGGLKLIKGVVNMEDYRSRQYYLTNKGQELIARLQNI